MVARTLQVLETFRARGGSLSFAEAVELCRIPKASTFRILETLLANGYLTRASHGRYRLTHKLLEVGVTVQQMNPWRRVALRTLQDLQQRCGETVNLSVLEAGRIVYSEVLQSKHSDLAPPPLGSPVAVNATAMGKAIAAWLPDKDQNQMLEAQRLVAFTPNSIVTKHELLAQFEQIRSKGYALEMEEETPGYCCVAAPIFGRTGRPVSAISITAHCSRMNARTVAQLSEAVIQSCEDVQRVGGIGGVYKVHRLRPVDLH